MARARILHTITTFATSAGAAEYVRLTAELLPRDRFEVFVASRPGQSMQSRLPEHVRFLPIPNLVRAIRPGHDLMAMREIQRLCHDWRFDVVNTHNSKDGILGRWAARMAGVPVIVHTAHTLSFRASTSPMVNACYAAIDRGTARQTQALLAVSSVNVRDYLSRGIGRPEQYQVVYSGLQLERYRSGLSRAKARSRLGLGTAGPWVGWIGRFNEQKDPLTFVRAARRVVDAIPSVQFVICGDDPLGHDLWPRVDALARELGVRDRFHVLGFRDDLPVVLKAIDLLMHSSRYEGMGRVVCEALACERAVVGTAVDGVQEVIDSGLRGGVLVPPESPMALADAAIDLLREPARAQALARSGRAWVERHLSASAMAERTAELYDRLLDRREIAEQPKIAWRGARPMTETHETAAVRAASA